MRPTFPRALPGPYGASAHALTRIGGDARTGDGMFGVCRARRAGGGLAGVALLILGALLLACGGSDDPVSTPAQSQPAETQSEPAAAEPQAREQAQSQADPPSETPDASEDPPAEEAEQADQPAVEEEATEEQAEEQAEEVAEEEQAEAEAPTVDPVALLSRMHLGSLAEQQDYRFTATFDLVAAVEDGTSRSIDLLNALGTVTLTGAVVPGAEAFEITISFGQDGEGGLPPFGVRRTGGVLYTNFGFGWEAHPPDAQVLELASVFIDSREFGFDFQALWNAITAQGPLPLLLSGDTAQWAAFGALLAQEALLSPQAEGAEGVQAYAVAEFELETIVRALVDPRALEDQLAVNGVYGGYDNREETMVRVELDAASGLLLRLVADIDEPRVDFDLGDDSVFAYSDFAADSAHLELEVDPLTGVPVRFLASLPSFRVDGEASYGGSLTLVFTVDALNAGGVVVEPPI